MIAAVGGNTESMRQLALASLVALSLAASPALARAQAANPEGEPKQPLSNRPSVTLVPERGAGTAQPAEAFVVAKGSMVTIRIVSQDVRSQRMSATLADAPCGSASRRTVRLTPIVRGSSNTTLPSATVGRIARGTPTIRVSDANGKPLLCGRLPASAFR
jgi:hypothetical protein